MTDKQQMLELNSIVYRRKTMIDKYKTLTHRNENSVVAKQHIKNEKKR